MGTGGYVRRWVSLYASDTLSKLLKYALLWADSTNINFFIAGGCIELW